MPAPHAVRSGQQPQRVVGQERDQEGEGRELSQTLTGPPPDFGGQGSGWEGALSSWDFPGGDSPRRETGPGWREKCPEKHTVPVGSGDVCSTVHGSYQLSTDPPTPPVTASCRPSPSRAYGLGSTSGPFPASWALSPRWSLNRPFNKKETLFKNPHPQLLHVILGQMNKRKLLLLTFMQNDRKGTLDVGSGPCHCQGAVATRTQVTLPGLAQAPQDTCRPGSGPSSLGWGWNVVPGARGL